MLDVLDNPSFINPWALPSMTTQVPQNLIQPVPQLRGARPKNVVPQKLNGGVPTTQSEVSGITGPLKQGKTSAPSIITSVGPLVSQLGEPSVTEQRHERRYTRRFKWVEPTENPLPTAQKVSICNTPEVITEQGTQRDSVPMELTNNTVSNSCSQKLDIIFKEPFLHDNVIREGTDCLQGAFPDYYLPIPESLQISQVFFW